MNSSLSVRHNFETGHRLPFLPGKCENLHGHSWWVTVTLSCPGPVDTVVEFGAFKKGVRDWVDTHLDHGLMLGHQDPLADLLPHYGKVHVFGGQHPDAHTVGLSWPTVENTAAMLARVATTVLETVPRAADTVVSEVLVQETHVNQAGWTPGWTPANPRAGGEHS